MIQQLPLQHPSLPQPGYTGLSTIVHRYWALAYARARARARAKKKGSKKEKKKKTSFHLSRGKNGLINIF